MQLALAHHAQGLGVLAVHGHLQRHARRVAVPSSSRRPGPRCSAAAAASRWPWRARRSAGSARCGCPRWRPSTTPRPPSADRRAPWWRRTARRCGSHCARGWPSGRHTSSRRDSSSGGLGGHARRRLRQIEHVGLEVIGQRRRLVEAARLQPHRLRFAQALERRQLAGSGGGQHAGFAHQPARGTQGRRGLVLPPPARPTLRP